MQKLARMEDGISSVNELLSYASFIRWADGTASQQEAQKWDRWCSKSEFNRRLAMKAQAKVIEVTPVTSFSANSEHEWETLLERIEKSKKNGPETQYGRKTQTIVWWYRVAAVVLIATIVGFIVYQIPNEKSIQPEPEKIAWKNIETKYGEQKEITLSDGSSIILASNSVLTYPDGWIQNRSIEVQLQGEAYFSITKRATSVEPAFTVRTSNGAIQVMGTRFVVDSEDERTRVVLEEGVVRIARTFQTPDKREKEFIKLEPNQLAEFSRFDDSAKIKKVNPQVYTSWTRQVLVLDNTSFSYLIEKIKKTYGVEVEIKDPELYKRRLTGSVTFRSLDLLVQAVSDVLEIEVRQTGNTVIFESKR